MLICRKFHEFGDYLTSAFLDDLIFIGETYYKTKLVTDAAVELLRYLALMYHDDKCKLEPVQQLDHLGFRLIINEQKYTLS